MRRGTIRIDSHLHFLQLDLPFYAHLKPAEKSSQASVLRDYMPPDVKPHLDRLGIDQVVVVQVVQTVAETTDFMLPLCDQYDYVAGVVGWMDMAADDFGEQLKRLRHHKGFVGIRPMLQEIAETEWILRPEVRRNVAVLEEVQFPLDLQIQLRHLPAIVELLQDFPQLKAVVDHAAMPSVGEGILDPWRSQMEQIAAFDQVTCKVSGLDFPAGKGWTVAQITPYVHHLVDVFGPGRLMWASNWPICLFTETGYQETYDGVVQALPASLSEGDRTQILGTTAAHFYGLS